MRSTAAFFFVIPERDEITITTSGERSRVLRLSLADAYALRTFLAMPDVTAVLLQAQEAYQRYLFDGAQEV